MSSTATLLASSMLTNAVVSITSGLADNSAAQARAEAEEAQADLMAIEADYEADRIREKARKIKAKQKMMFIKNGVQIGGTPLLILEETEREGEAEAQAMHRRGVSLKTKGYAEASATRITGTNRLVGGLTDAVNDNTQSYLYGKEYGIFK